MVEFLPLGIDGVLVRFSRTLSESANRQAVAFHDYIAGQTIVGVTDVAAALTSVHVTFDLNVTDRATLVAVLDAACGQIADSVDAPKRLWSIPAAFGPDHAPQLAQTASLVGRSEEAAVAEIAAQRLRVMAIGFAPGQPYLGMMPDHWHIPRRSELTERLPSSALITAVGQMIIFTATAPTGWHHIGQTAFEVYLPDQADPFPLRHGDAVQFCPVSDGEFAAIYADRSTNGGAKCDVLR